MYIDPAIVENLTSELENVWSMYLKRVGLIHQLAQTISILRDHLTEFMQDVSTVAMLQRPSENLSLSKRAKPENREAWLERSLYIDESELEYFYSRGCTLQMLVGDLRRILASQGFDLNNPGITKVTGIII